MLRVISLRLKASGKQCSWSSSLEPLLGFAGCKAVEANRRGRARKEELKRTSDIRREERGGIQKR